MRALPHSVVTAAVVAIDRRRNDNDRARRRHHDGGPRHGIPRGWDEDTSRSADRDEARQEETDDQTPEPSRVKHLPPLPVRRTVSYRYFVLRRVADREGPQL